MTLTIRHGNAHAAGREELMQPIQFTQRSLEIRTRRCYRQWNALHGEDLYDA